MVMVVLGMPVCVRMPVIVVVTRHDRHTQPHILGLELAMQSCLPLSGASLARALIGPSASQDSSYVNNYQMRSLLPELAIQEPRWSRN